jgi:FAD/FMN-containing dehydrogenase
MKYLLSSRKTWRRHLLAQRCRLRGRAAQCGFERAQKPDRFPEVIVRAQRNGDVVAAVQLANERGLKIGIRSGGHS